MIVRTNRKNRFTVINNDLIEDPSIDWKDLGMLVYLLSKPDNWEISTAHLMKERKTSRDGVYSILKNLCNAGYVSKKPKPEGGWLWFVYDEKQPVNQEKPDTEKPDTEKPDTDIPHPENPTLINTEYKQELNSTVLKGDAEKEVDPDDAMKWVEFFVNKKGFQFHEAQTASTMLMFREWVIDGVTIDDVELASIDVRNSLDGDRPDTPRYYQGFVRKVIREKQKSQGDRQSQHPGSSKKNIGNQDAKYSRKQPISQDAWWSTDFLTPEQLSQ
jgi:hypothetical protein